jgi:hypothetical protein
MSLNSVSHGWPSSYLSNPSKIVVTQAVPLPLLLMNPQNVIDSEHGSVKPHRTTKANYYYTKDKTAKAFSTETSLSQKLFCEYAIDIQRLKTYFAKKLTPLRLLLYSLVKLHNVLLSRHVLHIPSFIPSAVCIEKK